MEPMPALPILAFERDFRDLAQRAGVPWSDELAEQARLLAEQLLQTAQDELLRENLHPRRNGNGADAAPVPLDGAAADGTPLAGRFPTNTDGALTYGTWLLRRMRDPKIHGAEPDLSRLSVEEQELVGQTPAGLQQIYLQVVDLRDQILDAGRVLPKEILDRDHAERMLELAFSLLLEARDVCTQIATRSNGQTRPAADGTEHDRSLGM